MTSVGKGKDKAPAKNGASSANSGRGSSAEPMAPRLARIGAVRQEEEKANSEDDQLDYGTDVDHGERSGGGERSDSGERSEGGERSASDGAEQSDGGERSDGSEHSDNDGARDSGDAACSEVGHSSPAAAQPALNSESVSATPPPERRSVHYSGAQSGSGSINRTRPHSPGHTIRASPVAPLQPVERGLQHKILKKSRPTVDPTAQQPAASSTAQQPSANSSARKPSASSASHSGARAAASAQQRSSTASAARTHMKGTSRLPRGTARADSEEHDTQLAIQASLREQLRVPAPTAAPHVTRGDREHELAMAFVRQVLHDSKQGPGSVQDRKQAFLQAIGDNAYKIGTLKQRVVLSEARVVTAQRAQEKLLQTMAAAIDNQRDAQFTAQFLQR